MPEDEVEMTPEEIEEKDSFEKEEREEVEGGFRSFFKRLLGYEAEEPEIPPLDDEDEVDAVLQDWDGNPFFKDSKLYGQDFDAIKARCLERGEKFTDPWFPPAAKSLFYTSPAPKLGWSRPGDLCDEPKLFVDGADRFDINQGELGDCWLLAAMSSLAMNHKLFHKVLPTGQSFEEEEYAGIFKFRFWQYGEWVEVVVDDYLPVIDNKLAFIHSNSRNEFWSALMEKAYAKLHGSYEALKGGSTVEAMVDFTGGCGEVFELSKPPPTLMNTMLHCYKRKSMNGCSIKPDPNVHEARTKEGLVRGHAYTISKVVKAKIETPRVKGIIPLVRVRNPWGNAIEWNGTWSDDAQEWEFIPEEEKEALGLNFENDGEWWMSFKDFVSHFDQLEICNLGPECLDHCEAQVEASPEDYDTKWCVSSYFGAWINGESAGGCRNFLETFVLNPQYIVELGDPDDEEEDELCTLIVSLMQMNRRAMRDEGLGYLSVGFVIYRLKEESGSGPMDESFFKYNLSVARSKSYINQREVTHRFRMEPGRYLIVPSTFDPGYEGQFLLRTFSEKPSTTCKV